MARVIGYPRDCSGIGSLSVLYKEGNANKFEHVFFVFLCMQTRICFFTVCIVSGKYRSNGGNTLNMSHSKLNLMKMKKR